MLRLHLLGCCEVGLGTCKGVLKSWRSWSCSSRVSTSGARVTQRSSILTLRCRARRSAAARGRLVIHDFRLLRRHVGRRVLPDAEQVVLHPGSPSSCGFRLLGLVLRLLPVDHGQSRGLLSRGSGLASALLDVLALAHSQLGRQLGRQLGSPTRSHCCSDRAREGSGGIVVEPNQVIR